MSFYNSDPLVRPELTDHAEQTAAGIKSFLVRKLLPVYGVKERTGKLARIPRKGGKLMAMLGNGNRAPLTEYPKYQRTYDQIAFETYDTGGVVELAEDDVKDVRRFNLFTEPQETAWISGADYRKLEYTGAQFLQTASNYDSDNTADTTVEYKAANVATVDVVTDFDGVTSKFISKGIAPSELECVISRPLWNNVIKRSIPLMRYAFAQTDPDASDKVRLITPEIFARLFELKAVHIADSYVDVSDKKTVEDIQPCWSPDYILFGKFGGGDLKNKDGGLGRTLVWDAIVPQDGTDPEVPSEAGPGRLQVIDTWRDGKILSYNIRCRSHRNFWVVDPSKGFILNTGYSAT